MEADSRKKSRRHFDQQFKVDAVRLVNESGRPIAEIATELGVNRNQLDRWKRQLSKKPALIAFPGNGNLSADKRELDELRKELARTKEERDILKKAMAVFSRRP
jgi:transposase